MAMAEGAPYNANGANGADDVGKVNDGAGKCRERLRAK
jgi:hypothetical protein